MINDPMSQMAQAQKLSIPQIQQALRDGTINPQVGQIVLASKIKQDKEAKAAMAAQAPKQPPVVQQNAMYGQGVDALPSNLPTQGMAGGGIIAFDEGGEVPRFDGTEGSQVVDPLGRDLQNSWVVNGAADLAFLGPRMLNRGTRYVGSAITDAYGNVRDKNTMVIDPDTGKPISVYELKRKAINATGKDAAAQYRATGAVTSPGAQSFNLLSDTNSSSVNPNQITANFMADANKPGAANPLAADATRGTPASQALSEDEIRAQYKDTGAPGGAGAGKGNTGIDAFRIKAPTFDDSYLQKIVAGDNNPATGKPWTPEEITKKRRDEEEKAGIDQNIYKTQGNELKDLKEKFEKGTKLDEAMPWLTFAEQVTKPVKAGEAPPSTIGSLLGGAAAAGRVKGELTDKQEAKLDKIRTESNGLALAQNAFKQAQINGDRTEIKSAQDTLDNHYKALSDFGIKKSEANALAEAETKKLQLQNTMNERSVGATYYAADKAERNVSDVAMQIQLDNARAGTPISKSEATKQAYAVINPGFGAIDQRDIASQRTALTNQFKEIQKDFTLDPKVKAQQLKALQAKIDALGTGGAPVAADAGNTNPYGLSIAKS